MHIDDCHTAQRFKQTNWARNGEETNRLTRGPSDIVEM